MLGVLCIIGYPVQLLREFFRDSIFVVVVVDTLLPRFEALGYVLVTFWFALGYVLVTFWLRLGYVHFDELTHVVIRASSVGVHHCNVC